MIDLLFDYDGTLHESLRIYAPAVREAYDRLVGLGLAPPRALDDGTIRSWIGLPPAAMWDLAVPDLCGPEKERSAALVGERMLELVRAGRARLYPGVPALLKALRARECRLLLLSNCPRSYLQAHSAAFGLDALFDGLWCGEDFGYAPKYAVAARLRRPGAALVAVGDRAQDMEIAARCGGARAVGCRYGYGTAEELAGADALVDSPAQLETLLRTWTDEAADP